MQKKHPKILVVGSLVMDLISTTDRIPQAGETVIGLDFSTAPGGKGANQAVQAARLGASVTMVGKVGSDLFGQALEDSLVQAGVDTAHLLRDGAAPSAVGNIQLLKDGDRTVSNRILVLPGANYRLLPEDLAFLEESIREYDMVLLQLEIPMAANEQAARWAKAAGVPVLLNPAPSAPLSGELLSSITYIAPNEHEAEDLTGIRLTGASGRLVEAEVGRALNDFHSRGVPNVLITLGANGSVFSAGGEQIAVPCVPGVNAVDPTAAGDSFLGAFGAGVASGLGHKEALTLATHTAAITVSAMGAQPSLPHLEQVLEYMERQGCSAGLIASIREHLGGNDHE